MKNVIYVATSIDNFVGSGLNASNKNAEIEIRKSLILFTIYYFSTDNELYFP